MVEDGIWADEKLTYSQKDICVAGDIVSYSDVILSRNRIEHVDHARKSGEIAGKIIAGADETYDHIPYFYSKVSSISWQAIGKWILLLISYLKSRKDEKDCLFCEQ